MRGKKSEYLLGVYYWIFALILATTSFYVLSVAATSIFSVKTTGVITNIEHIERTDTKTGYKGKPEGTFSYTVNIPHYEYNVGKERYRSTRIANCLIYQDPKIEIGQKDVYYLPFAPTISALYRADLTYVFYNGIPSLIALPIFLRIRYKLKSAREDL